MKSVNIILFLLGIVAFSNAKISYTVYSDVGCTNSVSYFWSSAVCAVKRSIQAECVPIDGTEFYYMQGCTDDATVAPTGWSNFLLFPATTTCDRTTVDYLYYAVNSTGTTIPIVIDNAGNKLIGNVTVTCNSNGVMTVSRCSSGCAVEVLPNGECVAFIGYVGQQTACEATGNAPTASTPTVATPTAATPSKKSSGSVFAFSGFALFASLLAF